VLSWGETALAVNQSDIPNSSAIARRASTRQRRLVGGSFPTEAKYATGIHAEQARLGALVAAVSTARHEAFFITS
jgi:hypothetical protein